MLFFTVLFVLAKPLYKIMPSNESPLARFFGITLHAVRNRRKEAPYTMVSTTDGQPNSGSAQQTTLGKDTHWLDSAAGSGTHPL